MGWNELMAGRSAPPLPEEGERPAGWYQDPDDALAKRYWDGEQWGEAWHERERAQPTGKANRLAVTALICAAFAPILVGGILATVFGAVALDEIEESEGAERGQGMAKWAIGLGFLNIVVSCVAIVLLVLALTS